MDKIIILCLFKPLIISGLIVANFDRTFYNLVLHLYFLYLFTANFASWGKKIEREKSLQEKTSLNHIENI